MADWMTLLNTAVNADPRGIAGVAEAIGVSRPALSMVVNGRYPASTDKIAAKVMDVYARNECPHLAEPITQHTCHGYARRPAPTSSPRDMRHWRACQSCPHKE
jgi:hypothetical protein